MKTLTDWLAHLESLHPKGQSGIELGLERVARVKAVLRQQQTCPVIIVGGTNGKGSTCAYLEIIYRLSGYRVGCYSSPHLLKYNERVRVNGQPATDEMLCSAFARVEAARHEAGNIALTYFEFGTLAAWEVFAAEKAEVVILEVGLGGRLDAVNVYEPDCAVVTGVALDHTDWLGATREAIGFEKAGIFRSGRRAICADPEPPQSLLDYAEAIDADLKLIGRDFGFARAGQGWSYRDGDGRKFDGLPEPALRGECQLRNASAVITVLESLGDQLPVSLEAVRRGLHEVSLPGRFQIVGERPAVILDVAHNPEAVAELAQNLRTMGAFRRTIAVVAMLADKDIAGALAALSGNVDVWLVAGLNVPRGAPETTLANAVTELGGSVEEFASPAEAFRRAVGLAGENDRIAVFGSFHTVAAVINALNTPV
ncbi:bifunctional tetrahydrofolate synthase/dihydrofolate synthase [Propionivibrio limicola]|uniref:bifunctional tetrahydrofolate synthase/dihydrofolate synthase n=1 Tax=Propionivibrio limicola TaxID=167645 RepID=UPI0012912CC3|nr:bifunctional tetrahydrofolate synthase/dihydrofolate synthase [Propionivibrio limicola]